jgi:hypothetical protein
LNGFERGGMNPELHTAPVVTVSLRPL